MGCKVKAQNLSVIIDKESHLSKNLKVNMYIQVLREFGIQISKKDVEYLEDNAKDNLEKAFVVLRDRGLNKIYERCI